MSLRALAAELEAFAQGKRSREDLRRWLTPYLVEFAPELDEDEEAPWSPDRDDQSLFWRIVWLLEDGSLDEGRHRDLARRIVICLAEMGSSEDTSELLPLITARSRFCDIVDRHRRGVVSRTGLLAVVSKTFRFEPELRDWLSAAPLERVERLCAHLGANEYRAALDLISRPPA